MFHYIYIYIYNNQSPITPTNFVAHLHVMTNNPTRYEQIPSYVFRGVAFIKCYRRTDTITMSLDHGASEDNYVIKKHDMTVK